MQMPEEEVCAWADGQREEGQAQSLLESLLSVAWPEVPLTTAYYTSTGRWGSR